MASPCFTISAVSTSADLAEVVILFTSYVQSLGIDLSFQDFATEMATMPGNYSPAQGGILLLARSTTDGQGLGCVGLRSLPNLPDDDSKTLCEMKRLYVTPTGRGTGVGRALAESLIAEAKRLGYSTMRLDTLQSMSSARTLYKLLGFREVEAYYATPIAGTVFLELDLHGE